MKRLLLGLGFALATATASNAVTVDGVLDAAYGAPTAQVNYSVNAPTSNFGQPTNQSHTVAYDIYLTSADGFLYGYLDILGSAANSIGSVSNLYFDLNPGPGPNGSDLGFEITNNRAFVPGYNVGTYSSQLNITFAAGAEYLEFAIPVAYFTGPTPGLGYPPGQPYAAVGGDVVLRLSQSFGYSVAGGESYGDDRLGRVTLSGAVPEPATWAMMIIGFGAAGSLVRRQRRSAAAA